MATDTDQTTVDQTAETPADSIEQQDTAQTTDAADTGQDTVDAGDNTDPGGEKDDQPINPRTPAWVKRRIDKLTFEKHEREREAQELREKLARLEQGEPSNTENAAPAAPISEDDINRRAEALAEKIAEQKQYQREFNKRCDTIYDKGMAEIPDFTEAVMDLRMATNFGFDQTGRSPFIEAVSELDNAHKVLHHLGRNPDEAERIMKLSPAQMGIQLARLESDITKPKSAAVSSAPAPASPVNGSAAKEFDLYDPDADEARWYAEREKARAARRAS